MGELVGFSHGRVTRRGNEKRVVGRGDRLRLCREHRETLRRVLLSLLSRLAVPGRYMTHISAAITKIQAQINPTWEYFDRRRTLIKNVQENATKTVWDSGPCRT